MASIEKVSDEMNKNIQQIAKLVDALKNKQEIDYEYLSKIFDNLEKDFLSYRDIIINSLNKK